MNKKILVVLVVLLLFILGSCDSRLVETEIHTTFSRAWIKLGNDWVEMAIKAWRIYSYGIQITSQDGTIYMTDWKNVVLISK